MPDMNEKLRELIAKKIERIRLRAASQESDYIGACIQGALRNAADEFESLLDTPEPPGSVAGDEYEVAAREWLERKGHLVEGWPKGSIEALERHLAAHFRAACGSREAELETALRSGCQRVRDILSEYRERKEGDRPFVMGCAEWVAESELTLSALAARAKQGKEHDAKRN